MKLASARLRDVMMHYHEERICGTYPFSYPTDHSPGAASGWDKVCPLYMARGHFPSSQVLSSSFISVSCQVEDL